MVKEYKIGYTSGVFDLFHIGHLNILKRAKSKCDYLIVAITTDKLSLQKKGKIPIIPLKERIEIVSNVKGVDLVVPQKNMNKFLAWKEFKFNAIFVGDDWKGTDKWNELEEKFKKVNVNVVYFPYTKTTSSTLLRKFIEGKL